ncbi:MAG: prepilin-type N-terminal cleavage/methylation domain-containing protein [Fibrobacterota bacterium]|nr:prepilin-type N-terminal cleavage/methylation domain-containing protein [Fibrobacterota bacterium]QQS05406.1 MAG: prepilin-type N-terminal cleavage/methylation domain-containing protein [Fibrobacterota bacterium]
MNRRGYTVVEVLMALVILGILAVPLGYTIHAGFEGSARARREDKALGLVREEWSRVRGIEVDSLRDTAFEPEAGWRLERDVFDSVDRAQAGLSPVRRSSPARPPVEIAVCAMARHAESWDTVRCFQWMRPRIKEAP